jgi:hypothetical protein
LIKEINYKLKIFKLYNNRKNHKRKNDRDIKYHKNKWDKSFRLFFFVKDSVEALFLPKYGFFKILVAFPLNFEYNSAEGIDFPPTMLK